MTDRLYIAVREDLPAGLQAAQAVHAAIGFALVHPALLPETVILVGVPDELSLAWLVSEAGRSGFGLFAVHEPDLHDSLTAVALEPGAMGLCRHLPLLLREPGPRSSIAERPTLNREVAGASPAAGAVPR